MWDVFLRLGKIQFSFIGTCQFMPLLKWISNRVFNLKLNFTAKDTDGGTKINGCLGGETESDRTNTLQYLFLVCFKWLVYTFTTLQYWSRVFIIRITNMPMAQSIVKSSSIFVSVSRSLGFKNSSESKFFSLNLEKILNV